MVFKICSSSNIFKLLNFYYIFIIFKFLVTPHSCEILFPQSGIKRVFPAVGVQSLNH